MQSGFGPVYKEDEAGVVWEPDKDGPVVIVGDETEPDAPALRLEVVMLPEEPPDVIDADPEGATVGTEDRSVPLTSKIARLAETTELIEEI